jgi:hypothetical protein
MNKSNQQSFLQKVKRWLRLRLSLWLPVFLFLILFILLVFNPWEYWWINIFEGWKLYMYWPFLYCGLGALFIISGILAHRKHGRALHFPQSAAFGCLLMAGTIFLAITKWAMEWSLLWSLAALIALTGAFIGMVCGMIAYGELWRKRLAGFNFNYSVIKRVKEELKKLRPFIKKQKWGSPHCLRIIQGHYDDTKQSILKCLANRNESIDIDAYLSAGQNLIDYLSLRWPPDLLPPGKKSPIISQVLREMITIYLWVRGKQAANPRSNYLDSLINQFKEQTSGPYQMLMERIFNLARVCDVKDIKNEIHVVMKYYRELPSESFRKVCANSWLVLSSFSLPPQACFDVWMAMQEERNADLFIEPEVNFKLTEWSLLLLKEIVPQEVLEKLETLVGREYFTENQFILALDEALGKDHTDNYKPFILANARQEEEPAAVLGRGRLSGIYGNSQDQTPAKWDNGLAGRYVSTDALAKKDISFREDIWDEVNKVTRDISSWPYEDVWKTFSVRLLGFLLTIFFLALSCAVLIGTNPKLPGNWGWNTINHIADVIFLHDYTASPSRSMITTKDFVVVGTDTAAMAIGKESYVPRTITKGPVSDVARGLKDNDFFILTNQNIIYADTEKEKSGNFVTHPFLPAPKNPVWSIGTGSDHIKILANEVDDKGWLMVTNRGVTRYLFRKERGKMYRTRAWQNGPLANVHIRQTAVTTQCIWLVTGDNTIRCVNRDSLEEIPQRSKIIPQIKKLEADYNDRWASALDANNCLWLYAGRDEKWFGPFFGDAEIGCRLESTGDVTTARLQDCIAWLGTGYGFFGYNLAARRMSCIIPDTNVIDIEILANHKLLEASMENYKPSQQYVLSATDKGLELVNSQDSLTGTFSRRKIDPSPTASMCVSDDLLCVYRVRINPSTASPGYEVRAATTPFSSNTVVIPGKGWKSTNGTTPKIVSIKEVKGRLIFATDSHGAFFYDPEIHGYQDCSQSLLKWIDEEKKETREEKNTLRDFSSVEKGKTYTFGIADGAPYLFNEQSYQWNNLDPSPLSYPTRPLQLIEHKEYIYGIDKHGIIHQYKPGKWFPTSKTYLIGKAPYLKNHPINSRSVIGDLVPRNDGSWKLAMLIGGKLIHYDSRLGQINENKLELQNHGNQRIRELRLVQSQPMYLLGDNTVLVHDGRKKFGEGYLPFSPGSITAIAPGKSNDEILLGGPQGYVGVYNESWGSWQAINHYYIPANNNVEKVEYAGRMVLARLSDDRIFYSWSSQNSWNRLQGFRRWMKPTKSHWSSDILALKGKDIIYLSPRDDTPVSSWTRARKSIGSGMRLFVEKAAYVWQASETTFVFFSKNSQIGIYDIETDKWTIRNENNLKHPQQFVSNSNLLVLLDNGKIIYFKTDLSSGVLNELPRGTKEASLYLNEKSLQVVFVCGGVIELRVWSDLKKIPGQHPQIYSRGRNPLSNFDLKNVVYAQTENEENSSFRLVDGTGRIASYDCFTGSWSLLHYTGGDTAVYGWLPAEDGARIISNDGSRGTSVVMVSRPGKRYNASIPPEQFLEKLKWDTKTLVRPGDRVLLKTEQMTIIRKNNQTSYLLNLDRALKLKKFKPQQVALVEKIDDSNMLLLIDTLGNIVSYNPIINHWESKRDTIPGQNLYGSILDQGRTTHIILKKKDKKDSKLVVIPLIDGNIGKSFEVGKSVLSPESIIFPGDGTLFENERIKIVRRKLHTTYYLTFYTNEQSSIPGTNPTFHLTRTVYAEMRGSSLFLMDEGGGCVTYNRSTGKWTLLRRYSPVLNVYGWMSIKTEKKHLLLQAPGQNSVVFSFSNGSVEKDSEFSISLSPEMFLTEQAKWRHKSIIYPQDRTLLANKRTRIIRRNRQTTYQLAFNGKWIKMTPQPGGFANDIFKDAAFSGSGKLLALQKGKVINLLKNNSRGFSLSSDTVNITHNFITPIASIQSTPGGVIRLRDQRGNWDLFQESQNHGLKRAPGDVKKTLASLKFTPKYNLDFTWHSNDSIVPRWRNIPNNSNVWGTFNNQLAIQCVEDIALSNDNQLLIATEQGLLIRDSATFKLIDMYPEIRGKRFFVLYNPYRVFLEVDNGFIHLPKNKKFQRFYIHQPIISSVKTGYWNWQLSISRNRRSLQVLGQMVGHLRSWTQTAGNQWKFNDDIVNWIGGGKVEQNFVWSATKDGVWKFVAVDGRTPAKENYRLRGNILKLLYLSPGRWLWEDSTNMLRETDFSHGAVGQAPIRLLPSEEFFIENPAIKISYNKGRLTFTPFDGRNRETFAQGRFFFDSGRAICSHQDMFYILIPNRCILCRSPTNSYQITGCWPLHPKLPRGNKYSMQSTPNGIRVRSNSLEAILNPGNKEKPWGNTREIDPTEDKLDYGSISWRLPPGARHIKPYLSSSREWQQIDNYWSDDRFSWDRAVAVGALKENNLILVTPMGIVIKKADSKNKKFKTTTIWPSRNLDYCTIARESDGRPIGLEVGSTNQSTQYFIEINLEGNPVITPHNQRNRFTYLSTLVIGWKHDHGSRRYIGMSEVWEPFRPAKTGIKSVLKVEESLFPGNLFQNGQFIFDQARNACKLNPANSTSNNNSEWVSLFNVNQTRRPYCLVFHNEIHQGKNRPELRLLGIRNSGVKFIAIRATPGDNGFFGLYKSGASLSIKKGYFETNESEWTNTNRQDTGQAFRLGESVKIDASNLNWTANAFYLWDRLEERKHYMIKPKNYRIFTDHQTYNGKALTFDVFESLVTNKKEKKLVIGTRGGILIYPDVNLNQGNSILELSESRLNWFPKEPINRVSRVRYDNTGNLWVKFDPAKMAQFKEGNWIFHRVGDWPIEYINARGYVINVDGDDFEFHDKKYLKSNDGWTITGQKNLSNIVDFTFDNKINTLWICSRDSGIFKVTTD